MFAVLISLRRFRGYRETFNRQRFHRLMGVPLHRPGLNGSLFGTDRRVFLSEQRR
jgi:hypothetical protein